MDPHENISNCNLRLLQQRLQIIGATKNEQMVISIVPYITLYYAIHSQYASRKSYIIAQMTVQFPPLNQLSRKLEIIDVIFMLKTVSRSLRY